MAKVVTTEELKKKIDGGGKFHLVDVLSEQSYESRHIPGAKNVPLDSDFLKSFEVKVGATKDAEIIVYCSSSSCQASPRAAAMLEEAGYINVAHYKDGLAGWQNAGYKFEGEAA